MWSGKKTKGSTYYRIDENNNNVCQWDESRQKWLDFKCATDLAGFWDDNYEKTKEWRDSLEQITYEEVFIEIL